MKKSNLRDGDIVEFRDGRIFVFLENVNQGSWYVNENMFVDRNGGDGFVIRLSR